MYYSLSLLCHIPAIEISVVVILCNLSVIEINYRSAALRNHHKACILNTSGSEVRKHCYIVYRIALLVFHLLKRKLCNKVISFEPVYYADIEYRLCRYGYGGIKELIPLPILCCITSLFKVLFKLALHIILGCVSECIYRLCTKYRVSL